MGWQFSLGTFAFSRGSVSRSSRNFAPGANKSKSNKGGGRVGPSGRGRAGPGIGSGLGLHPRRAAGPPRPRGASAGPAGGPLPPSGPRGLGVSLPGWPGPRAQAVPVQAGPGKLRCAPPPPRPPAARRPDHGRNTQHTAPRAPRAAHGRRRGRASRWTRRALRWTDRASRKDRLAARTRNAPLYMPRMREGQRT